MRLLPVYRLFSRFVTLALLLLSGVALSRLGLGQQPSTSVSGKSKDIPQSRPSGMSTGGIHAPVKDSHLRPITAGGFVDGGPAVFVGITHKRELAGFHHRSGSPETS